MTILSITRDWGMDPSIVRIVTNNTLAEIGTTDYIFDESPNIYVINGGQFFWYVTDMVLAYGSDGWGFFTITPDFRSLTLLITSNTTGYANAPINTNITEMRALNCIQDTSGNNNLCFTYTTNAINYLTSVNGAINDGPQLNVTGSGNIDLNLTALGSGGIVAKSPQGDNPLVLWPQSDSQNNTGVFSLPTITANRTYTLQDDDGTLAFTSDISSQTDYVNVTGTSQIVAENTKYIANNGALVTFTIPATFGIGKWFKVVGAGAGGWRVQQAIATHQIKLLAVSSTLGIAGTVDSTDDLDGAEFVCIVENDIFNMQEVVGNPDLL